MAYVTLQDVKDTLKITSNEDDALLTKFIGFAQDTIEMLTSRKFEALTNTTRYFDAISQRAYYDAMLTDTLYPYNYYDGRVLYFDNYDICEITEVVNGDGTVIASSNYVPLPINETPYYGIRLKLNANVIFTWNNTPDAAIAVTGKWAYSATPPNAIKYACERLAYMLYRQKDVSADLGGTIITNQGIIEPMQIPKDVMTIIMTYRRLV